MNSKAESRNKKVNPVVVGKNMVTLAVCGRSVNRELCGKIAPSPGIFLSPDSNSEKVRQMTPL